MILKLIEMNWNAQININVTIILLKRVRNIDLSLQCNNSSKERLFLECTKLRLHY